MTLIRLGTLVLCFGAIVIPVAAANSSDCDQIAYAREVEGKGPEGFDIHVICADGTGDRVLFAGPGRDYAPRWTASGESVVVSVGDPEGSDIFLISADGSEKRALTDSPGRKVAGTLSSDGDTLVFLWDHENSRRELYLKSLDGDGEARRLTNNQRYEEWPAWSPDGEYIAFSGGVDPAPESGMWFQVATQVVHRSGCGLRRISPVKGHYSSPSWSPDGKYVAVHGRVDDIFDIFVVAVDGSSVENITRDPADDRQPDWSPDGKELAYAVVGNDGATDLWIIGRDGSNRRRLTERAGGDEAPSWRPRVK